MKSTRMVLASAGLAVAAALATATSAAAYVDPAGAAADAEAAACAAPQGTASYYYKNVKFGSAYYNVPYAQAHIDSNPCAYAFRAYIVCDSGMGTYWRYGEQRTGSGSSNAWSTTDVCGPATSGRQKGFQYYAGGKWNTVPR
ncbi:hypothetical protein [Nonomuraea typhae]|uniref:Uncharacterized protein n=1 Tax=Nonomuraea typhae TaxID=2603600 RepID=A0ABW7Z4H5_9ACTN